MRDGDWIGDCIGAIALVIAFTAALVMASAWEVCLSCGGL